MFILNVDNNEESKCVNLNINLWPIRSNIRASLAGEVSNIHLHAVVFRVDLAPSHVGRGHVDNGVGVLEVGAVLLFADCSRLQAFRQLEIKCRMKFSSR